MYIAPLSTRTSPLLTSLYCKINKTSLTVVQACKLHRTMQIGTHIYVGKFSRRRNCLLPVDKSVMFSVTWLLTVRLLMRQLYISEGKIDRRRAAPNLPLRRRRQTQAKQIALTSCPWSSRNIACIRIFLSNCFQANMVALFAIYSSVLTILTTKGLYNVGCSSDA